MLTKAHRQEALSRAYVQAVAACAGLSFSEPRPDYGVDLWLHAVQIRGRRRVQTAPALGVQIKSATRAIVRPLDVQYDLEVKAYDDLREPDPVSSKILFVVTLPAEEADWVNVAEGALTIYGTGYWVSLRGAPPTESGRTVRIRLPRAQVLTVAALSDLMKRLKQGAQI